MLTAAQISVRLLVLILFSISSCIPTPTTKVVVAANLHHHDHSSRHDGRHRRQFRLFFKFWRPPSSPRSTILQSLNNKNKNILQLKSGSLEFTPKAKVKSKSSFRQRQRHKHKSMAQSWNQQILQMRESISESQDNLNAAIYHVENPLQQQHPSSSSSSTHWWWILAQLSGWDTCAVVSAVTTLISLYYYDNHQSSIPVSIKKKKDDEPWLSYLELAMDLLTEGLHYAGIANGLFGTLVFSLLSIHGRRLLQQQQQQQQQQQHEYSSTTSATKIFVEFFQSTSRYQQDGMKSFRTSIDLLGVQTILFLQSQVQSPNSWQWAGVAIIGFGFWKRLREIQSNLSTYHP